MDTRDVPGTPEWRPQSSLSGDGPSTATSSILQLPHQPQHGDRSSTSSGDYSGMPPTHTSEPTQLGREIAPFEPQICERLTEQIRSFSPAHSSGATEPHEVTPHLESLAALLRDAAVTIRYNARWFAQEPLAELLKIALDTAAASSASVDLSAAIALVDAVGTYSTIPRDCLLQIAQFLAQTYYNATRANKTKKLADAIWTTMQRILESHLGVQLVVALLQIVGDKDYAVLESKTGYARIAGALMVIFEKLLLKDAAQHNLPTPPMMELLESLQNVAVNGNDYTRELIMDMISVMLADDNATQALIDESSWSSLLETVEPCISLNPDSKPASAIVDGLISRLDHLDTANYDTIGLLCIDVGRPLDPVFRDALFARWCNHIPTTHWKLGFEDLLMKLSAASQYTTDLEMLLSRSTAAFTDDSERFGLVEYARNLQSCIEAPATTKQAVAVFGKAMVKAFVQCNKSQYPPHEITMVFNVLCGTATKSIDVAKFLLLIRADAERTVFFRDHNTVHNISCVPLQALDGAIFAMLEGCDDWANYYHFITELPQLLGNHTMFNQRIKFISQLMMVVNHILETAGYQEPPSDSGLTKSHVAVRLIEISTAILSYHRYLSKQQLLGLISVLLSTARSRDYIVSIPCIHALTICCYELPDLMGGHMDDVIDQMARMVTQRYLAIHVLLFLAGLSRLPDLYRNNFKTPNYKMIFGVCGSYLQSIRGSNSLTDRHQTPSSDKSSKTNAVDSVDALPQYVYALAHHVIAFWYIALAPHDRHELKEYITSCLKHSTADGKEVIEDQGLVTIDLMDLIDADELAEKVDAAEYEFIAADGRTTVSQRLNGLLLISTETALRTGQTVVTVRRPSGTAKRVIRAASAKTSSHPAPSVAVSIGSDEHDYMNVLPGDTDGGTYGRIYLPPASSPLGSNFVLSLPEDDDAITRAIQFIDRTPGLDSHKAGVIYIGEGQTTEEEILQNVQGSPDYVEFVENLGTLRRLRNATFNTQGLDRIDDADGPHTIVWNNEVTELVFHITTLMPNDEDVHLNTANKKRHIGNDFVNIVFNNSGGPFDFNTFPSQFNAVYIVITPSARTSFLQTRLHQHHPSTPDDPHHRGNQKRKEDRFYTVRVLTRPGYPPISSASASEKIVSGASLPGYVRNLALNDCVFALMWNSRDAEGGGGEYPSSWRSRLEQVRRVRERFGAKGAGGVVKG